MALPNPSQKPDMGRKSTVDRLAPAIREHIERRLRENRLTLDELLDDLRASFPDEAAPSRSALGRYRQGFDEVMRTQKAMSSAASALVAELGENFDDKSGALLAQAVTTLTTKATFRKLEDEDVDIADVLDLARAAKAAQETRSLSLKERQAVASEARARLLAEQQKALGQVAKSAGLSDATVDIIYSKILGIE
ncbi:MAG: phage protein Gp27 family protein [Sulfuricellaceae bacterium]